MQHVLKQSSTQFCKIQLPDLISLRVINVLLINFSKQKLWLPNFKIKMFVMNFRFGQTVSGKVVWNHVRNIFWKFEPNWMRQSMVMGKLVKKVTTRSRVTLLFFFYSNWKYVLWTFNLAKLLVRKLFEMVQIIFSENLRSFGCNY